MSTGTQNIVNKMKRATETERDRLRVRERWTQSECNAAASGQLWPGFA